MYAVNRPCKPKLEYGRHVARRRRSSFVVRRRRRAHAPEIHAAIHVDREKEMHGFSISVNACGSLVMVLRLAALWAAGAPL